MLLRLGRGMTIGQCGAGIAAGYLDSVIGSACCDLDATIAASYPGTGQTWANLIASPADGAAQADYDFYLGADGNASTDDPAFTGTAGGRGAYFAMDGGDYFRIPANTAFFKNLHKSAGGTDFWLAFAYRQAAGDTLNEMLFATNSAASVPGLRIIENTSEGITFLQRAESGSLNIHSTAEGTADADTLFIVSYRAVTGTLRFWVNSGEAEEYSVAFETTTTDPDGNATIGAETDGGFPLQSGSRLYSFAAGNGFLSDADAGAIIAHLETRHGRDYTP